MVKKVKKIDDSASIEMPMAQIDDADDVAEDYEVFDMSNIAAPVIEFELPNLVAKNAPKTMEKAENDRKSMKKPKKSVKIAPEAQKSDSEGEEGSDARRPENAQKSLRKEAKKAPEAQKLAEKDAETGRIQLTAEKLNNELVGLRATVTKAKDQWISKVIRKKKELEKKRKEGKGGKEEVVDAKLKRMMEEILALKTIDRDTIAKFASLNTKTLNELKIDGSTPMAEQVMYKLACHEVVVSRIQAIKQKYIEWNKTAAFFMQRLGRQYSTKPEKKEKKAKHSDETKGIQKAKTDSENVVDSGEESDVEEDALDDSEDVEKEEEEGEDAPDDYDQSDVEMVDSDDEDVGVEAAKKRRNMLLNLIGVKEDASRPALNPKKRKIVDDDSQDVTETTSSEPSKKQKTKEAMKAVLEKALKAEKVEKPKKMVPKKVEVSSEVESEDVEEEADDVEEEEDPNQQTLVMKIDLSQGGKIAKSTAAPKSTMAAHAPKKASEDVEEENSEDESSGFFLPASSKGTSSASKSKAVPESGGIAKKMEKLGVEEDLKMKKNKNTKKKGPVGKKNFQPPATTTENKKKGTSKNSTSSEGQMHPSWLASQAKKKELAAAKPAGKRILFNDED
ncbi:hypothetical protein L3Y34_013949 [Caenorhabditis briggsae]|uniref:Serum response factor-binding protein 1 n=1 Tax=Caenorhabditis briggsae TaxID=6238 RepID=A0AAE9IWV0_CAEBR|nr:hypothetical protein L3Y34_013949 [Caenorhabditis briggsae]